MVRKAIGLLALAVAGAVALGWRDIGRFLKIKMLSAGPRGHPEYVPAAGRSTYPHQVGAVPHRKEDFDPASRGGPA